MCYLCVCECIGLRNIVIMMYMYLSMLNPINDLNLNLNLNYTLCKFLTLSIHFIGQAAFVSFH